MTENDVMIERRGAIALVTLNRPEKMNALSPAMQETMGTFWEEFRNEPALRVAIVTGTGRAFCSGRDLLAHGPGSPEYHRQVEAARERGEDLANPEPGNGAFPTRIWKPIIAAVNGHCLAAGYALALACDIRIASPAAKFGMPAARRGLFSGGQALRTLLSVPFSYALEMMLTGEAVDAETALRIGLINRVVPEDQLLPSAFALAEKIAANAPLSVNAHKEFAYRNLDLPFTEAARMESGFYTQMLGTEDVMEGSRAFAEKRPAVFRGK